MQKKLITPFILLLLLGFASGYLAFRMSHINSDNMNSEQYSFEGMNADQLYAQIIKARDFGIAKAQAAGEYNCCITPACTMCYMAANKWNYNQPGKCFCDEFIAKGEEPCPQCKDALACESDEKNNTNTELKNDPTCILRL